MIIDGATGTELQARGVPMIEKGWSVRAQLDYPDVLQAVHEDYLRAGASVIITNTFAAGRHMLEPAGLGDRVEEVHQIAVEIAKRARDRVGKPAVVAGSISHYVADYGDRHWLSRLDHTFREQATLLAEFGVDVIALEMMDHPELAVPAVRAAAETGLPVWLGLSARREDEDLLTSYRGERHGFDETARVLIDDSVAIVFVMHTALSDVTPAVDVVKRHWDGPIGVYPEAGYYEEPVWHFVDTVPPTDLVTAAQEWADNGVVLLGTCCGLGVDHIAALSEAFGAEA